MFYWIAGVILVISVGNAVGRFLLEGSRAVNNYPAMTREERMAEYEVLRKEADTPVVDLDRYFEMLYRFNKLGKAMEKARMVLDATTHGYGGRMSQEDDFVTLNFLEQNYVNFMLQPKNLPQDERFIRARDGSPYVVKYKELEHLTVSDPIDFRPAVLVYFSLIFFTFGRFVIRIEEMGGKWYLSAFSDWRFPFWLMLCPVGVFKYPTTVDVMGQMRRAYRFAVMILSSSLTLAAAGCAGKRVKTEPDDRRVDQKKSWQVNVDTVTWPKYLGSNGAVFHPGAVEQSSATATSPSGLYFGTWISVPLQDLALSPNYGRELDGSAGWVGKMLGVDLTLDATWVGVTPISLYGGDVVQFTVTAGKDLLVRGQTFSPYMTYRHATPTVGDSPGAGTFLIGGFRTSFSRGRLSSGFGTEVMHDSGAFGFNSGWFSRTSASVGAKIGNHWKVEVPFQLSAPLTETGDGRKTESQLGLRVAWVP